MASLASLVSLGSTTGVCSSTHFEGTTLLLVPRISFPRDRSVCGRRWRCLTLPVCRYSVTTPATDYVADQGSSSSSSSGSSSSSPTGSISLDSAYRGSTGGDAAGLVLKPSPKPAPKPAVKPVVKSVNSSTWVPVKFGAKPLVDEKLDDPGERNKVIESLGEVLEKAEKLESASFSKSSSKKESGSANKPAALRPPTGTKAPTRNGKLANSNLGQKPNASKPTTLKSVWRKGSPVTSAPVPVKDSSRVNGNKDSSRVNGNKVEKEKPKNELPVKVESQTPISPRPAQPPLRAQPTLQARPSAAPPPLVKRPVILRDVGAQTLKPQVTDETDKALKPKERKPILIDKYASKKRVVDPAIAKAVIAPPKPTRSTNLGKFKDGYRKKGAPDKGTRRRMLKDDMEIPDDEAAELNVSIPGATTAKRGRKWHKARRRADRLQAAKEAAPVKAEILEVGEKGMTTEELANNLAISQGEILGSLYAKGIKLDGVQTLDKEIVKVICKDYEVEVIDADPVKVEETARKEEFLDEDDLDKLEERAPVLTIMGHVDHGKTTLLDSIRKSKVAASEAGGITQGIGAYKVLVPIDGKPQLCVFLDTPGHEAFGAMRARGARVTDIAIIVVAADDGLQPQTNEAIAHAKAAGVPIIVAINKIDKDGANPQRVMQELSSIGLMPEEWGGDIPIVQISALKGENVDELLETVMLVAELQELKANPHRLAKGTVIEAGLHKSKGPVATFIVQNGTLKRGDVVVCGGTFGKVRALSDDVGNRTDEAGPSMPAQVVGLNDVPVAGDVFEVVESLHVARTKAEVRAESIRSEQISAKAGGARVTLSSLAFASSGKQSGLDLHQLNIILKVDVQGSIEAVRQALQVLPQDNVILKFLLEATGDVNSSDVDLAIVSKSIIFGFNVKAPAPVKSLGERKGVEIRIYRVIYELIDDVRAAMEGLLETVEDQVPIGTANVRATFSSGSGRVAGCMVTEGKIQKGCGIRVIRNRTTVHVGDLFSLRRVKEIVKEVPAGLECGIGLEDYDNWEVGDTLEAFNRVQKIRTLEEAAASMAVASEGCLEQT